MKNTAHSKFYILLLLIIASCGINLAQVSSINTTSVTSEVLFDNYGTGYLENGSAHIYIDPLFSKNIIVDKNHKLKVFIQLEGNCNGVYVTNKTAEGFLVKELQNGKSNVEFSWHIVANRKDEGNNHRLAHTDQNQTTQAKHLE